MEKIVLPTEQARSKDEINNQLAKNVAEMYNIIYSSINYEESKDD